MEKDIGGGSRDQRWNLRGFCFRGDFITEGISLLKGGKSEKISIPAVNLVFDSDGPVPGLFGGRRFYRRQRRSRAPGPRRASRNGRSANETCAICHGVGRIADVIPMHAKGLPANQGTVTATITSVTFNLDNAVLTFTF